MKLKLFNFFACLSLILLISSFAKIPAAYSGGGGCPICHSGVNCNYTPDCGNSCCIGSQACCNGVCMDRNYRHCCGTYSCLRDEECCDGECCSCGGSSLSLKSDSPEMLLQIGWLYFGKGNWNESISFFENGLAKLSDNNKPPDVIYALARMYEETGNKNKAIETYVNLISLIGEENPKTQKVDVRIMSLVNN
jgi:tetratricopeptide (TPR) repeat protein